MYTMKQFQGGVNMKAYSELTKEELLQLQKELTLAYEEAKEKGLQLDMSRGKPSASQSEYGLAGCS